MSDRRPECIYGVLVRQGQVFLTHAGNPGVLALPGGIFRPLAEDRKVELKAHLYDQLGILSSAVWAQGAFLYQHPAEPGPRFSGFYTVWEWEGEVPETAGVWLDSESVAASGLPVPVRVLLLSVLATLALRTR